MSDPGSIHLAIGTPCYGGQVTSHFTASLLKLQRACDRRGIGLSVLMQGGDALITRDVHTLRFCFTRFFPEVPIDCYVEEPLFHPNVKPETGFVCLWEQANPRDTVIQALARTQAIAAFRMLNAGGAHLMNRQAAEWYESVGLPSGLVPLTWEELRVYEIRNGQMAWLEPGRQLNSSTRTRLL